MDLHSGLPYWIAKNPLFDYFNPLEKDIECDVVIIGSGITGALVAHELCSAGIECVIVDKRSIATGSSMASTALLQYEIDTPLSRLIGLVGEINAVKAYEYCLQSIDDIGNIFREIDFNPDFKHVPSVYFASNKKGRCIVESEYAARIKYGLPVNILGKKELRKKYGFKAPVALENNVSAQLDPYMASVGLISYHLGKGNLEMFTHTEVLEIDERRKGCRLYTSGGKKIKCKYIVIAAGFEAGEFLPRKVMKLTSTYAIISQPLENENMKFGDALIWETKEPYLYIRTGGDNRIVVGGEDEEFKDPVKRDRLMRKKVGILEKKFMKLFPDIPFVTDMAWCGTFSSTEDGLPFIGNWPGKGNIFYALGYGGNGITFSVIAAQMIKNKLKGIKDDREAVFGFERVK